MRLVWTSGDDSGVVCTALIVDDDAGFAWAAHGLFNADGSAAMVAAAVLHPQLVLVDVQLSDFDRVEVARWLAERPSVSAVVLISRRGASAYRHQLVDSPARGFITKSELAAATLAPIVS